MHSITSYTSNAHTNVVVMYVIAMFITSDDASLRILSMTLYNIVTFIMIGLTFTSVILSGKLSFRLLPELKWLYLTLIWIVISLVASKVMDSKTMLDEVYNYQWATGVNSPELRGISFTVRFILSLFVIQFIISSINTREKYVTVMKYFLWMVCIFALFPLLQIILISIFNIEIGNIYYERSAIRIGGYVGEPSVLAGMLCCGLFSIVATILFKNNIISFNKHFLMVFLGIIIIDLYMTSSTSIITAIMLSVIIFARKYLSKKSIILAIILIITLLSSSIFQSSVLFKVGRQLSTVNIRSLSWVVGFNTILDNPISGIGIGQAPFYVAPYLPHQSDIPFEVDRYFKFSESRYTPMNTYLEFLAETGFVGLLLLFLFIRSVYMHHRNRDKTNDQHFIQFAFGVGLFTIAIAINSFPGGFYLGYLNFMIGMYIAGLKIYSTSFEKTVLMS